MWQYRGKQKSSPLTDRQSECPGLPKRPFPRTRTWLICGVSALWFGADVDAEESGEKRVGTGGGLGLRGRLSASRAAVSY